MGQACSSTGLSPPGLRCLLRGVGGRPLVGSAPDRRRESGPGRTGKASVRSDLGGAGDSAHQFRGAKLTPQAFPRGLRVRRWAVHRITRLGFISAFCLADVSTKVISISSFNFQKSGIPSSEHHACRDLGRSSEMHTKCQHEPGLGAWSAGQPVVPSPTLGCPPQEWMPVLLTRLQGGTPGEAWGHLKGRPGSCGMEHSFRVEYEVKVPPKYPAHCCGVWNLG